MKVNLNQEDNIRFALITKRTESILRYERENNSLCPTGTLSAISILTIKPAVDSSLYTSITDELRTKFSELHKRSSVQRCSQRRERVESQWRKFVEVRSRSTKTGRTDPVWRNLRHYWNCCTASRMPNPSMIISHEQKSISRSRTVAVTRPFWPSLRGCTSRLRKRGYNRCTTRW